MKKRKTVLITGGAGFIGSHLCAEIIRRGDYVICMDNFSTGNISHVKNLQGDNFEIIRHDIIDPVNLNVDQIYNLACPASPKSYQANPVKTWKTSTIGIQNMLGIAHSAGARILHTSTSEIYGDPLEHPQKESYRGNVNIIGPRACYDEGKRAAETLCFDYHRYHNVSIRIVRIFNTYGPQMDPEDGRVISNFIVQALKGEDITIYGDGSQTRSFCYVSDLVRGLVDFMEQPDFAGPMNLGNDGEFTIRELAELVIRLTGSSSKICYRDLPPDDPTRRRPDLTLAKKYIQYRPEVSLEEGLKRTIPYYRALL